MLERAHVITFRVSAHTHTHTHDLVRRTHNTTIESTLRTPCSVDDGGGGGPMMPFARAPHDDDVFVYEGIIIDMYATRARGDAHHAYKSTQL